VPRFGQQWTDGALRAREQPQVRALDAGGSDEGRAGFRAACAEHFNAGYLRDPEGNKIALF
jgi:hypothetical protein